MGLLLEIRKLIIKGLTKESKEEEEEQKKMNGRRMNEILE